VPEKQMPKAEFFSRLGLFVAKGFIDPAMCESLRFEMRSGIHIAATVVGESFQETVNESVRSTKQAKISVLSASHLASRLSAVKPMLENHFNVNLGGCEKPQFLIYREGNFFLPHQDGDDNPSKPEYIKKRKLSAVIFLNNDDAQETESESYRGGDLTFYGLIDDPRCKQYGFPLFSEVGLLVAFRSETFHEVTPVTRGERYTIVSWFF
jgi:SM-20-related protein